jgi:hypothetical protein
MNKTELTNFLLEARTKTYASGGGKVTPALLKNTYQSEYREGDWFYRDVFYGGNGIFMGLEAVYFQDSAVWGMSYYGNHKGMSEKEIDKILREALMENWETTRTWRKVEWTDGKHTYVCEPDFEGSIDEMSGAEKILENGKEIYHFFYAGGLLMK